MNSIRLKTHLKVEPNKVYISFIIYRLIEQRENIKEHVYKVIEQMNPAK